MRMHQFLAACCVSLLGASHALSQYGPASAGPGPTSALAYRAAGSASRPGIYSYSTRNYVYGGYGTYSAPSYTSRLAPQARTSATTAQLIAPVRPISPPAVTAASSTETVMPYYYGLYGYPSTFYLPTVQSYLPYATPGVGYQPGRAPVYSVTFGNGATLSQSSTGYSNSSPAMFGAYLGQPSYAYNRGAYGQDLFPGLAPGQITYGMSTQAALTPPGYYANYVAQPGATYDQIHSPGIPTPGVGGP